MRSTEDARPTVRNVRTTTISTTTTIRTMNRTRFSMPFPRLTLLLLSGTMLLPDIGCASSIVELQPVERGHATGSADAADAAPERQNPDVSITLPDSVLEGRAGDTIMVSVRVTIAEGTRMYSDKEYDLTFAPVPFSLTVGGDAHLTQAGPVISDAIPVTRKDEHFDAELEYWVGSVLLTVPVLITGEEGETYDKGSLSIEFMSCDDKACHPPERVRLPFTVVTVGDAG
jgi:hypothetical protein